MRPYVLIATLATITLVAAVPASAVATPARAPLGPQVQLGPTLHPSGNDRLVERGGSGTQGWAMHDPDGDYNYGVDQPGGPGGLYLGDQDGNNGCGNDQDFEDDNNGRCGGSRIVCVDSSGSAPSVQDSRRDPRSLVLVDCTPPSTCDYSCSPVDDTSSDSWWDSLLS